MSLPGSPVPVTVGVEVATSSWSAGESMVGSSGGVVSTVHVCSAGVGSTLPAASTARTCSV